MTANPQLRHRGASVQSNLEAADCSLNCFPAFATARQTLRAALLDGLESRL
jgi:hypothetical protein